VGFLKNQIEKSIENALEKKRLALGDVLAGETVVIEFSASMTQPKMVSDLKSTRLTLEAVAKSSPALCWITQSRLLVAYKNVHLEGSKISDGLKLIAEPVNVFITSLEEIFDLQVIRFGKSDGMVITTRNSICQFVSTNPTVSELVPLLKPSINKSETKDNSTIIDIPEQLRKFAELRDNGIITEEEFLEQKKKLLS
jgi:hypothetical protein